MFGLIKLALYGIAGYAIYQFYLGMTEQNQPQLAQGRGGQRPRDQRGRFQSSSSPMTGGGEGMTDQTEEPTGMSSSHQVGRGVIAQ